MCGAVPASAHTPLLREKRVNFTSTHDVPPSFKSSRPFLGVRKIAKIDYSKTCLKRNAIVPVFFFRFHRFPLYKGLCFNKIKYKNMIA